jgi:type II secretory pathway pseudopilin PulG
MLELIVVVTVMAILSASLVSGYTTLQKNQRLNSATDKVMSMLYKARSLAISNNAVYHVRIDNFHQKEQYVSIYKYARIAEALQVHFDPGPPMNTSYTPNPVPGKPNRQMAVLGPNALNPTPNLSFVNPETQWLDSTTGLPDPAQPAYMYNNVMVDSVKLEPHTYAGIQVPMDSGVPSSQMIFFYPDGTAETGPSAFIIYVTDDDNLWENRTVDATTYTGINNARLKLYGQKIPEASPVTSTTPTSQVQMIQVLRGGLIKTLKHKEALP